MTGLFRVVAVLASAPAHPQGDPSKVLTLHVPLTADGQLDAQAIAGIVDYVVVECSEAGQVLWASRLLADDQGWAVRPCSSEDTPLWRMDVRSLRPGDYLTIHPEREREHGYRVVNVEPL